MTCRRLALLLVLAALIAAALTAATIRTGIEIEND